ncbi:tail fiber domain-containing protein [Burkholderia latens]|uniref:tail fiber domain-containing protein n=1 Tax=Burkholderia latens TaxID=488446 RepID=UPI001AE73E09|nr:tail fiber domain-containing protein [Burkholderia latens]QTO42191.1 hypothetical protein J8I85_08800 [Burkholderia latens]
MTVPVQTPIIPYVGNGVSNAFAFPFAVLESDDLKVAVDGVTNTIGVHYTIDGVGNSRGGTVNFSAPPAQGAKILIYRSIVIERDTDYKDNGDLLATTVNADFDRIWMALQDMQLASTRSIRYPIDEYSNDGTLPPAADRVSTVLGFDVLGNQILLPIPASVGAGDLKIENWRAPTDFTPGVSTAVTLSRAYGAKSNLGSVVMAGVAQSPRTYSLSGTTLTFLDDSGNPTPIPSYVSEIWCTGGTTVSLMLPAEESITDSMIAIGSNLRSIMDANKTAAYFGIVGNGLHVDTAAFTNMVTEVGAIGGGMCDLNRMKVVLDASVTLPKGVHLLGHDGNPEQAVVGTSYFDRSSLLILASGASLTLGRGGSIQRMTVLNGGLPTSAPISDAQCAAMIAAFSGTGILMPDTGGLLRDVMILGFNQCIDDTETGTDKGRTILENVKLDGNSGFLSSGSTDINRLWGVHAWPFMTAHVPGVANSHLMRSGKGFDIRNINDWTELTACFAYGYDINYSLDSVSNVGMIACQSDSANPNTSGVSITGNSSYVHINGFMSNSSTTGIEINSTGAWPEVRVNDFNINAVGNCIDVTAGGLIATNGAFHSGTQGIAFGSGTTFGMYDDIHFYGVSAPVNFASSAVADKVTQGKIHLQNQPIAIQQQMDATDLSLIDRRTGAIGTGSSVTLAGQMTAGTQILWRMQGRLVSGATGNEASDLYFSTYRAGAFVDRMKMDHDGGISSVSDQKFKTEIQDVPAYLLDMMDELRPRMFKMVGGQRWVVGRIAQDIETWLRDHGYNPAEFSFWNSDPVIDADGNATGETYQSLAYEQLLALDLAALRRRLAS